MKEKNINKLVNIIILVLILAFIFNYIQPKLLFTKTTTAGGDTASHYYPAEYMRDYLLPHGKIIGWSPGWYAGFPMFQFYFPFPFIIIALLSYIIPLQISFKLITILGTILLPITTFLAFKLMKFKDNIPIIAAIFTLPFLFMEANSMWGGNIPSTFAGEFSYSLGISLTILYFGLLYDGITNNKHIIKNSILLALIGFNHVYTLLWAVIVGAFFLITKKDFVKNFKYLLKINLLAFLLLGFWILPLITRLGYTTAYASRWGINKITEVFPEIFWPFYLISLISLFFIVKDKDKRMFLIIFSILTSGILYLLGPKIGVVDIRFLPFIQLLLLLIAPYILSKIDKINIKAVHLVPFIIFILTALWVSSNITFIPGWASWNYQGFESKSLWPQYSQVNELVKGSYNDPRVVYEHNQQHNAAGTTRAFESLPLFSGRSTLEGLYMQSTPTSPFVFYIQSEISKEQSCPFPHKRCTSFNLEKGTEHLKLFNVQYFIAISDQAKNALKNNSEYKLVKDIQPYQLYELTTNENKYVTVLKYQPIFYPRDNWTEVSYEWFKKDNDVLLIFDKSTKQPEPYKKVPINTNCNIQEQIKEEEILFTTDCVGLPHLIKISYFPNWKVEGAEKVYLVSPSFMLVYPNQENVRLYYGLTSVEIVGYILTVSGILIILLRKKLKIFKVS